MAVTVYTPSPALTLNDANANTNFRVLVKLSAASNGSLRVRFQASFSNALEIYGASFGKWDGVTLGPSNCDMTTTPFRLTFGGSNSTTVASNSTVTSDLIAHPGLTLNAGDWVIVAFYNNNDNTAFAGQKYSSGHTTATTMFKQDTGVSDRSQQQTITTDGAWNIVANIQPGSSGGYNFSVDLVESNDPAGSPYTMVAGTGTVALAGQAATLSTTAPVWTFVGVTEAAVNASGNYTLTEPAGVAQGDLLIVDFAVRGAVIYTNAAWTFTQSDAGGNTTNATTASDTSFQAGYCIRGASPPSYVFARTGGSRALGTVRAYRSNKGAPVFDTSMKFAQTTASSTITMSPSITTATTNELIVSGVYIARAAGVADNASNMVGATNLTGASGAINTSIAPQISTWTERSDRGNATSPSVALACYDAVKPTSGATGSLSVTGPASALHGMIVMAFKHPTVVHRTMTADTGTVALAGQAATLTYTPVAGAFPPFRSFDNTTYASRTNTTVNAPAGVVDGDIILLSLFQLHGSESVPAATFPAGFTIIDSTLVNDGFGFYGAFNLAWKRASGEGSSYTITHATGNTQAVVAAYSGCVASGSPIDAYSTNPQNNTNTSGVPGAGRANSVTTTVANTKLVFWQHNWDASTTLTPPTGFTERYDHLTYFADKDNAPIGATGNVDQSQASSSPSSLWLIALKPAAGGGVTHRTMPAATGTAALSGQTAALRSARRLPVTNGTAAMSGQPVGLRVGRKVPAGTGTVALSGQNVTLRYSRRMPAGLGTLTLAGPVVNLIWSGAGSKTLPAGIGFLGLGGQPATLRYNRKMPALTGTLTMSGQATALWYGRNTKMTAGLGTLTLSGQATELLYGRNINMPAEAGTLTLDGQPAALRRTRGIPVDTGALVLSGRIAGLIYTERVRYTLPAECGVVRLSGISVDLRTQRRPPKPQMLNFGHTVYLR